MSIKLVKPMTWFWGLLGGLISGGALACSTGPTAALFAPEKLNIDEGLTRLLLFMLCVFVQGALGGAMLYLAKNPVPQLVENGGDTTHISKP